MEEIKKSKYNYGEPIDLDLIPIEDTEEALQDFASGSLGLEICLRVMWQRGLKTHSCYPGNRNVFDIAHITMAENEDVFCYMSEAFLNDDKIRIDITEEKQVIRFAGNLGEKNCGMIALAQNIISGKKKNRDLVATKIGEPFPEAWIRRLKTYTSNEGQTYWSERVLIKDKPGLKHEE